MTLDTFRKINGRRVLIQRFGTQERALNSDRTHVCYGKLFRRIKINKNSAFLIVYYRNKVSGKRGNSIPTAMLRLTL